MGERTVRVGEMEACAREILEALRARPASSGARVLALSGELGAGKTTLTQALARELGVAGDITSPTFVIEKRYQTTDPDFKTLVHIDAYRLERPEELSVLGFAELLHAPHTLIVIEWAERVSALLPEDTFSLTLSHIDETTRSITFPSTHA